MKIIFTPLGLFLAMIRMLLIIGLVATHGALIGLLPEKRRSARAWVMQSFGRTLTWTLGIRITLVGQPSEERAILISNHRSYADIPVLAGITPVVFLAKAELAGWPVIGWAARKARTVFVDRHNPESRERSRKELGSRLEEGLSVLVFSEGTTTARGRLDPLKPGMFHEAVEAGLPLQLVYLEFSEDEDSWIGDANVAGHFFSRFSRWRSDVKVCFRDDLLNLNQDDMTGTELCQLATAWFHEQIQLEIGEIRP